MKQPLTTIFFGNHFYGICAVLLAIESSLQQKVPLNSFVFYLFLFAATIVYYTKAYISQTTPDLTNKRSIWYVANKTQVRWQQFVITLIAIISGCILLKDVMYSIPNILGFEWILILIFPLVGALYYGIGISLFSNFNLRNTGWLKPFVIGFVWAGLVNIYPVLYNCIKTSSPYTFTTIGTLLSIKNFMYIAMLCIMFDIKDYAADHNHQLKTFVVRVGLRKTIFFILIPLSCIGLGTFLIFAFTQHFPSLRILFNIIPFVLLITVAYSMHQRKSILYYLAIIDGLMLIKAFCGIAAMLLTK